MTCSKVGPGTAPWPAARAGASNASARPAAPTAAAVMSTVRVLSLRTGPSCRRDCRTACWPQMNADERGYGYSLPQMNTENCTDEHGSLPAPVKASLAQVRGALDVVGTHLCSSVLLSVFICVLLWSDPRSSAFIRGQSGCCRTRDHSCQPRLAVLHRNSTTHTASTRVWVSAAAVILPVRRYTQP